MGVVKSSFNSLPPAPGSSRGGGNEHRCSICWTPFGKSAIRCPNEPEVD